MIAAAPDAPLLRRDLHYPHGDFVPDFGAIVEVHPGIYWTRVPLPFALDHINLWVLDNGDSWAIVDTGFPSDRNRAYWRRLFAEDLADKPVGRVIVTHYHPDHIGLAGWMAKKGQVAIEISRNGFLTARTLTLDTADQTPAEVLQFYAAAGWPKSAIADLRNRSWGRFALSIHRLPIGYHRLRDGDELTIGTRKWQVVVGSGHSPEHVCLFDPVEHILIAGDQVLPRITSNVSVQPGEPDADPLADWLESIDRLRQLLPADTLVLPAHNEPFTGLHTRLDQLAADHHEKLDALLQACADGITAYESFSVLFRGEIGDSELQLATGEALAHLHWLHRRGRVTRRKDGDASRYWRA